LPPPPTPPFNNYKDLEERSCLEKFENKTTTEEEAN
jgi:hypothetical protein